MKIQLAHTFDEVISVENMLEAWKEFIRGKRKKQDVQEFQLYLMDNIFSLHGDLTTRMYRHGEYHEFHIFDPKPRVIHKASVRDRLLHHAIYRTLYPFFDRTFIADSYSCRIGKGTHKALNQFRSFGYIESKNNTRTCWILKCDIRKFFANINHAVLTDILRGYIPDAGIMRLLEEVVGSFSSTRLGVGLPLGNLTSQLLVNIYMNEFDQFAKHRLKAAHYIRYADDFVIMSEDRGVLEEYLSLIGDFLRDKLMLGLHPDKVFIKTLVSGVDFLGWVHFPDHRVLRTSTKRRMMKRVAESVQQETIVSYCGLLRHGNAYRIRRQLLLYLWTRFLTGLNSDSSLLLPR
ncbi:MAG: reverse transcriptase domain-containing protein [bacterium]|nr:reverse transcriptase domain-containing protein [bacterium]